MIEITDEMWRTAFDAANTRGCAVPIQLAIRAVAPLIEAQARERALREAEDAAVIVLNGWHKRSGTLYELGTEIKAAISALDGAPPQKNETGASRVHPTKGRRKAS